MESNTDSQIEQTARFSRPVSRWAGVFLREFAQGHLGEYGQQITDHHQDKNEAAVQRIVTPWLITVPVYCLLAAILYLTLPGMLLP